MSVESVRRYLNQFGASNRIIELQESSATVALAAHALHTQPERIAKSLTFLVSKRPILIVLAGDARIANPKFKRQFQVKAHMLPRDQVEGLIGQPVGGVCPFALKAGVAVYLDQSLRQFTSVFPAAGSPNSAIEVTLPELEQYSHALGWVDIAKEPAA
ncbi:YbaK/EbsC family protein [Loigolactobacillus backii]|uniref:EbsC protein n=1 Tax=Loigolactobacillus backii TaxID=375175 RepID=A0A192GXZ4_9LACO|nr:YbaK/EbsC family protein [Loigolactobacillus backii]ANK58939.1 EbsC protein [Loigolactobacillus backii]ANK61389.1 EbsC protein [Loigolactobacillus backii]ANK63927.1 EbsC protein [Loigolactobacillus backii]ANK66375.1 EbsC protein [Loigolactobacillus backii]ANK69411.1 EbsC protein [Loigolactobacillus backii]